MIKVHNVMAYARAQGASWDQINQELTDAQQQHLAAGGDYWDMLGRMGFGDPQIMRDRLDAERRMATARGELRG